MSQKILKHVWMNNLLQTLPEPQMLSGCCVRNVQCRSGAGDTGRVWKWFWPFLVSPANCILFGSKTQDTSTDKNQDYRAPSNQQPAFTFICDIIKSDRTGAWHHSVMQCNVDHDKIGHCLRTDRGHFVTQTPSYTWQNMGNWRSLYIITRGHKVGFT